MKIPKKIRILGHDVKIIVRDRVIEGGTDKLGSCLNSKNLIFIDSTQAETQKQTTLLHEIIEQVNWGLNIELNEKQICCLESGLWQVLNDNNLLK